MVGAPKFKGKKKEVKKDKKINIILLDLVMPKADGFFVLEYIQKYNKIADEITKRIVDKEKNDDFGFLSSVVKWTDDSICKMNVQKYNLKNQVADFETNGQKIKMASFVSLFVKKVVIVFYS